MPTHAKSFLALCAALAATVATPAWAATEPSARLVDCEAGSCLLVSGRRTHAASTVSINGHAVAVEGSRKWRATVPVATLRAWSAPFARTITVSTVDNRNRTEASTEAELPIGMLGYYENLAMLVVRVK